METISLLLGGQDQAASTMQTFDRTCPSGTEPVTRAAAASVEDARRAVDIAAGAFPAWSHSSNQQRRKILFLARDALIARADLFVDAMATETGATESWARFNVTLAGEILNEAAGLPSQIQNLSIPSNRPGCTATAMRQAAGVVFAMAPWNAPVILGVRALAAPLACGNTVVMKSSELCPRTHRLIVEAMLEAGVPGGALNLISTAPEDANKVIESVIAHPAIRRINFTGSTRVGRIIAEIAGRHLKPALLELGGKAPLIVLDDADIDAAVAATQFGAYINQGQICMSTERVIVQHPVAERFVSKLADRVRRMNQSESASRVDRTGGVVDQEAAHRLAGLISDALSKGATLEAGGKINGVHVQATLLSGVTPAMRIYAEESFGPVACVIRAGGDDEAIRIANDTEYGLSAAVFSQNPDRAMATARRIESGICHINGPTVHDEAQMPFGGMKASGYGRFGGTASIHEFTELRWITVQEGALDYPD
ncbi:MAG: aldehyde dehydrogenase [Burkholderiaceae bacterium]